MCHIRLNEPSKFIQSEIFSDLNKLYRVTALALKFVDKLRKRVSTKLDLMKRAKILLIQNEQLAYFAEDIQYLRGIDTQYIPTRVNNLNLFIDDHGLLRSKGRLSKCTFVETDVNNPIIIPKDSHLTKLIIYDFHLRIKHLGSKTTMTAIRNGGFWIPKGRNCVIAVLNTCITCKKLNTHAFKYPKPNDYPNEKVNFKAPYRNTGMDFTGHVFVKMNQETVKMYILVFTCLNIRSVHLELVPSLSSAHFLQAFIRFCNLYCIPETVFSDNASTFIHSMKLVSDCSVDNDYESFFDKK